MGEKDRHILESLEAAYELLPKDQSEELKKYDFAMRAAIIKALFEVPNSEYIDTYMIAHEGMESLFPGIDSITKKYDEIVELLIQGGTH